MPLLFYLIMFVFSLVVIALLFIYQRYKFQEQRDYIDTLEESLQAGAVGVLIFDKDENLKHINTVAEDYFDVLRDGNTINTINDFISYIFDHSVGEESVFTTHLKGKVDFREVVKGDEGQYYLVEMRKGNSGSTTAMISDVSLLNSKHEDVSVLNKMNEELKLAIESTSCGVFIIDPKIDSWPMVFVNKACRRICSNGDASNDYNSLNGLLEMLGDTRDFEEIVSSINHDVSFQKQVRFEKDQDVRWFDFRLTPIFDGNGEIDLFVGVLSEVTELKSKEIEVSRAQKLDSLGQLSAGIAHDFNNILSIVEGYARMIEMNAEKPERMLEYAKKIQGTSARGAGLTQKMMAFARHKVATESVVDLAVVLQEQEALLKPLIPENMELKLTIGEGDMFGSLDVDSFTQILMNLVINARDAIRTNGRIRVFLDVVEKDALPPFVKDASKDYVCLRVLDNGSGMPKEVCERIFDPFFTTKEQGKGTGLGLSVVYGLIRDLGGYVDVRSELSVGTEFSVYIPRSDDVPDDVKSVSGSVEDLDGINFEGFTALIVEDENDLRDILSEFLSRRGMTVLEADSGNEALVIQDDHIGDIDVLITDIVMPGINGLKLAEMIVSLRPTIQTVYMSGYPARGEHAEVELPEDALFMPKPLDFDALALGLFNLLQNKSSNVVSINKKVLGEKS